MAELNTIEGDFAIAEPQARFDLHDIACRAEQSNDGWTLRGKKSVVVRGPSADQFVHCDKIILQGIGQPLVRFRARVLVQAHHTRVRLLDKARALPLSP